MARPLRIEYEGAFYHVTARGNERRRIFQSERDYQKFLANLKEAIQNYKVVLHAYVLMGNHYHLLVETPQANLEILPIFSRHNACFPMMARAGKRMTKG